MEGKLTVSSKGHCGRLSTAATYNLSPVGKLRCGRFIRLLTSSSVQYHTAVLQHFNPLLHSGLFVGKDQEELRRLIVYHARSGFELFEHSQRLYSARFAMPLLSFCLVHICDTLLRLSSQAPEGPVVVKFCLEMLQQTRTGFPLCGTLQHLFVKTIEECGVLPPADLAKIIDSCKLITMDQVLDACTRLTYTQPLSQIIPNIDPSIANDFNREWDRHIVYGPTQVRRESSSSSSSSSGRYLQIGSLLNS